MNNPDRGRIDRLESLPNIGPAIAALLRQVDIDQPSDLAGRDPYQLYTELCRRTGKRHDPCLLDTFIAVVAFMNGEEARPWWHYSAERKRRLAEE